MDSENKFNILHGPYNFSGIAGFLSKAQRDRGLNSRCIVYHSRKIYPNEEENLELDKKNIILRFVLSLKFFTEALWRFNIFHFYAGKSFFFLNADLPILKLFGKKIIMTYTGSDIRLIELVEKKYNPYYHLFQFDFSGHKKRKRFQIDLIDRLKDLFVFSYNHPKYDRRKVIMMKYHNLWVDKFVAIKGNYSNALYAIPQEKIIKNLYINHIALTESQAVGENEIKTKNPPVIVHAPNHPLAKGTNFFEDALDDLKKEGLQFEYLRISGIPNNEVQEIYRNKADIMVDQFIAGDFGTFSLEGMKYGKAVMCYLRDDLIENHFPDIPIYNTNIDNIKENLKELILNEELRLTLGKQGPNFVNKYVSIEEIHTNLVKIYKDFNIK
ncbi:glycosyltransferase [Hyphobacterium sp. CCMP332]|nr:glycosyltransferase [Hyphobacterium sp. CCMP332]